MTAPYFVDANIFVYALDPRDPVKQKRARNWLDHLWRKELGRTGVQALSEAYVALRRLGGADPDALWASVAKYFVWRPLAVDESVMRRAREIEQRFQISWWDSMVVAAAQLQDCAVFLTEDLHDGGVYGTVTVRSPFTLSFEEPGAEYAVAPIVAPRHRPRGRPKRLDQPMTRAIA